MFIHAIARTPMRQKGAVLVIGLIFLVVITLIGITAMQRTTLDTKITGNYRSYTIAFEGGEGALSNGENRLCMSTTRPIIGDTQNTTSPAIWSLGNAYNDCTGATSPVNPDNPWWFSCVFSWWQGQVDAGRVYAFPDPMFSLENNQNPSRPMYLIEQQLEPVKDDISVHGYSPPPPKFLYRITARSSTGQNSQSDVMLQSIFAWRYNQ